MKGFISEIRNSKYHKFISGIIFACLAFPFFVWGIYIILMANGAYLDIIIPFVGMLICLLFGLRSMFQKEKTQEVTV